MRLRYIIFQSLIFARYQPSLKKGVCFSWGRTLKRRSSYEEVGGVLFGRRCVVCAR